MKNEKILIYIGANTGQTLSTLVDKYDKIFAFEPIQDVFLKLSERFANSKNVKLINAACDDMDGFKTFYVTPNIVSSSLSKISTKTHSEDHPSIKNIKEIKVATINLKDFLIKNQITNIDLYYSDCQGYDLKVLTTIKDFLNNKRIKEIYIETHGNGVELYENINNELKNFKILLEKNYELVNISLGRLDGKIINEKELSNDELEFDCFWKLK